MDRELKYETATDRYEFTKDVCLGAGAQGIVLQGRNKKNHEEIVAVKRIKHRVVFEGHKTCLDNINKFKIPKEEFNLIQKLNHPNIIRYLDYGSSNSANINKEYIVMEYMENKSLSSYMDNNELMFRDESKLERAIEQILFGVKYLHDHNIVHRDIKPGNILVSKDLTLKISGSKLVDIDRSVSTHVGTTLFYSPDRHLKSTKETDLWSVGITILCMCVHATYRLKIESTINTLLPNYDRSKKRDLY
ncbi:hypothetical protein DFA_11476 [Cavenderia fasciculata]|uniref:Protein kinase domain-containing protein n=1 Tax=Cavenderia fasciculata TaxID=261658 RepID=F4QD34_CACFS|nr:uncharacterized protein DFA_11476 [Cavenderia fasciculata]EGG13715.1 hypothetical protein DFA_11476 [Cavenderia fasciculata]|eukprot:XP_004350419.1 hypothetical protein DFA_11476 [Cavenderia fasciculata]